MASLPAPGPDQVYVQVSALNGGWVTLPEKLFVTDADPDLKKTVPSMCFLVQHPTKSGKTERLVFDLGIKRDLTKYAQGMQDHLTKRQPIITSPDTAESLRKGGLDPAKDIDYVVLSHTHWDHIGMPSDYTTANFIVGSGTLHTVVHGANHYPAEMFEKDPLPLDRTKELAPAPDSEAKDLAAPKAQQTSHTWSQISSLRNATDLFGDGSVYLINAPGHLMGHLNLLARLGPDRWVYLGGDCCHDCRIITGEKDVAEYDDGHGGLRSVHSNLPLAKKTIKMIQEFIKVNDGKVEWIIAHDLGWSEKNKDRFWPGKL